MTTLHVVPPAQSVRDIAHPGCVACSPTSPIGLRLSFQETPHGVRTTFECATTFEGYPGVLHGGIIATILDGAMVNALFARGYQAVTAELLVRFRVPVAVQRKAVVEAHVARDLFPLFMTEASLTQDGQLKATASAKFMVSNKF
jgi:acyl-coenzyme A thioesterase PaaI-like protein